MYKSLAIIRWKWPHETEPHYVHFRAQIWHFSRWLLLTLDDEAQHKRDSDPECFYCLCLSLGKLQLVLFSNVIDLKWYLKKKKKWTCSKEMARILSTEMGVMIILVSMHIQHIQDEDTEKPFIWLDSWTLRKRVIFITRPTKQVRNHNKHSLPISPIKLEIQLCF